ncbi:15139_t:CDS:2 [Acaulospora morrowiae]|uniref:15139_t:CDS:1 n=1 Tax=Acaulospora morrowiae TaxID=94023 RepID=A0A9N8VZR6_9GLOM|nr:15139_t:CDS:2 [Acaulospora morrowiae]
MSKLELEEHRISIPEEKILDFTECRNSSDDEKILSHFRKDEISIREEKIIDPVELHFGDGNNSHNFEVFCSPKMEYIATVNYKDRSVYTWKFTKSENGECGLKLDHFFDLKKINLMAPISVSDFENILIGNSLTLEITDYEHRRIKILNTQEDLKGRIDYSGFLENGDLIVIEGDPVYQVHIFSKKDQWRCTDIIKLVEYRRLVISRERVLILLYVPFIIMQWNLATRKFEAQYELDWSLAKFRESILMELNNDCTLLAVAGRLYQAWKGNSKVYFYCTKTGTMIADQMFVEPFINEPDAYNSYMGFITLKKREIFLACFEDDTSYVINPRTFLKSKNPGKFDFMTKHYFAISGYIVRFNNGLQIESLSPNIELKDETGKDDKIDLRSYREEVKEKIENMLEKYKLNQDMVQVLEKYYIGQLYTWIVHYVKSGNALIVRLTAVHSKSEISVGRSVEVLVYTIIMEKDLTESSEVEEVVDPELVGLVGPGVCGPNMLLSLPNQDISHETLLRDYIYDTSFPFKRKLIDILIQTKRVDDSLKCINAIISAGLKDPSELGLIREHLLQNLIEIKNGHHIRKNFELIIKHGLALYYKITVEEITKFVKKMEDEVHDEISRPYLSPAIKEIIGYEKKVDEKMNELHKKFETIDKFDKKFEKIDEKFEKIDEFDKKFEKIDELDKKMNEIIELIRQKGQ